MRLSWMALRLGLAGGLVLSYPSPTLAVYQPAAPEIQVLDAEGSRVDRITDGDQIRLSLALLPPSGTDRLVQFSLDGHSSPVATCALDKEEQGCQTPPFETLGWYWSDSGAASPSRSITAEVNGTAPIGPTSLHVAPRPVVMVHGFASSWEAWIRYLGPSGYLAESGLSGFAVGDGQVAGSMKTGSLTDPAERTNTIAENATALSEYIEGVKKATGAHQVDLIAHSMGGLITRYYIDRVMEAKDVAQLLMLGSPMAGTDCADLPAALGLYLPATLEIRPSYVTDVFNVDITGRHGVPFHALAGVPILEGFQAPCTDVPSDLAVSLRSVTAIPLEARQIPVLHMNLNLSEDVFREFVQPLLQTPPGGFPNEPDPPGSGAAGAPLQFSRVFTGHVAPGEEQELTVPIDSGMTLASFALYDSTRSLDVSVRGASGNTIELSPEANGLVVVRDPDTLFYLGYGFQNPRPGAWRVTLKATKSTPSTGADFALAAHFLGGAQAEAQLSAILPQVGEEVTLTASLGPPGMGIALTEAEASIRDPSGALESIELAVAGSEAGAIWTAAVPGLYGIDVSLKGTASDGMPVERTVFLALEAQAAPDRHGWALLLTGAVLLLTLIGVAVTWLRLHRGRRRSSSQDTPRI